MRNMLWAVTALIVAVPAAPAADPTRMIPDEADVVASLDMKGLLASEVGKEYVGKPLADAIIADDQLGNLLDAVNLDPLKDITRVTLAGKVEIKSTAGGNPAPKIAGGVALLEGRFDKSRLENAMRQIQAPNVKVTVKGGRTIAEVAMDGQKLLVTVVSNKLVVAASTPKLLSETLAKAAGRRKLKPAPMLTAAWKRLDKKSALAVAYDLKGEVLPLKIPNPQAGELIKKLKAVTLQVAADKDVKIELGVGAADAATAQQFQTVFAQLLPLAKLAAGLQLGEYPQIQPHAIKAANSLKAELAGNFAVVKGTINQELIDALIKFQKEGGLKKKP